MSIRQAGKADSMKKTKNLDRVTALRSWAHGREHQKHRKIDSIGIYDLFPKLKPKDKPDKPVIRAKAKKPLFSTELVSELYSVPCSKVVRPELARKIARQKRRGM